METGTAIAIAALIVSTIGAIGSAACAWYARDAIKRRGRHRR
jgi:uncharacterized protein YodC (DUF2158 family)